jgi:glycosyltransferase involved in cell wall biosynthesis
VIDDGVTGYVVEDELSAVPAVELAVRLPREKVRQRFEERFTARRMARDYLAVYRSLMVKETPHLTVVNAHNGHRPTAHSEI